MYWRGRGRQCLYWLWSRNSGASRYGLFNKSTFTVTRPPFNCQHNWISSSKRVNMFPELIHKMIRIRKSDSKCSNTNNSRYTTSQHTHYYCSTNLYFCIIIKSDYIMSIRSLFYIELELGNKIHVYSSLTSSTMLLALSFHSEIMSFEPCDS